MTETIFNLAVLDIKFSDMLSKMRNQDKHRHSETRDRWAYAHAKVTKLYDKKAKK